MTREDAIKRLTRVRLGNIKAKDLMALDMAIIALQEQKVGKWKHLLYVGNDNYDWECSECGFKDTHSKDVEVPFCWHCGAKMEGAGE